MADMISDGNIRVDYVPTIADISAPTVTELDAGTPLSHLVTADGLVGFEASTAEIDTSKINSTFDTKRPGRASYSGTLLRMCRQDGTDTVFDLLLRDTQGFIVVRRKNVPSGTAWTAAQEVEVYPGACGEVNLLAPEANSLQRYEVPWMISPAPNLRAEVTAGP